LSIPGVPKLGFHDLRQTFASRLIRQGIDPVRASRQLGHARPLVTLDIYAHEFEEARGRDDISEIVDGRVLRPPRDRIRQILASKVKRPESKGPFAPRIDLSMRWSVPGSRPPACKVGEGSHTG
jgi:integrase-like protein